MLNLDVSTLPNDQLAQIRDGQIIRSHLALVL
jgi:hypothetical protein